VQQLVRSADDETTQCCSASRRLHSFSVQMLSVSTLKLCSSLEWACKAHTYCKTSTITGQWDLSSSSRLWSPGRWRYFLLWRSRKHVPPKQSLPTRLNEVTTHNTKIWRKIIIRSILLFSFSTGVWKIGALLYVTMEISAWRVIGAKCYRTRHRTNVRGTMCNYSWSHDVWEAR
jgi:hypothetical protein